MPRPNFTRASARVACAILACAAFALACAVATSDAASSATVVTMDVPSATELTTLGCPSSTAGTTDFGVVTTSVPIMTSNDCTVSFGSSNDSASLRLAQSDGVGTAMARPNDTTTRTGGSASPRFLDVDSAGATVWAIDTGSAYRSLDGGLNWGAAMPLGVSSAPQSKVAVPDAATVWASTSTATTVAAQGRVARSDGGAAFVLYPTTGTTGITNVYGVAALNNQTAWAVGSAGQIRRTTNGGTNPGDWVAQASGTAGDLMGVTNMDANSLVAWGANGLVVMSIDGATWKNVSVGAGFDVRDVAMISDSILVAVGMDGSIFRTANAHLATPTWTQSTITPGTFLEVRAVEFSSATNGMATGADGLMLTTTDGGITWTRDDTDTSMTSSALTRISGTTWVSAGMGLAMNRTTDDGANWTLNASLPWNKTWHAVSMTTDGRGWRVGSDGSIERSTDAAATWTDQAWGAVYPLDPDLFGVYAFDPLRVTAVGRDGTIVSTSDGGANWSVRTTGVTVDLLAVHGTEDGVAWAVGDDGSILRSNDFGASWSLQQTTAGQGLLTVAAVSNTTAVAFGRGGVAWRTTDSGATWTSLVLPTGTTLVRASDVLEDTTTVGYVAGTRFVRSTDGGATWTILSPFNSVRANDITWVTPQQLYGVTMGTGYVSQDGGATWSVLPNNNLYYGWLYGVDTVDRSRVVIVGDGNIHGGTGSTDPVADYQIGVSDWYADGTEAFGACLRATTANATWTPNATCDQSADGAHWRGIPTSTANTSEVASTLAGDGLRTASFRFGLRIDPAQTPGVLSAGIVFVVIAPDL